MTPPAPAELERREGESAIRWARRIADMNNPTETKEQQ